MTWKMFATPKKLIKLLKKWPVKTGKLRQNVQKMQNGQKSIFEGRFVFLSDWIGGCGIQLLVVMIMSR